jgi:endoglucanase
VPFLVATSTSQASPTHRSPATARSAAAAPARRSANPTNPLANRPWGVYEGDAEQSWPPYQQATGLRKKLLAKIALRPKARWFGSWIADRDIAGKVRDYIDNSIQQAGGNKNALVQMTIFRVVPWEQDAHKRLPTAAEQASYKKWIDNFARAVGRTHTAIVLQPDGPFANQAPHHSLALSKLVAYAAKTLSAKPNTSVYIEAGSADWTRGNIAPAMRLLTNGGVRYARGFALNGTHYDGTVPEIAFGTRIVAALQKRGYGVKHFVISTAENGRPFTGKWWHAHPTGTNFNNAGVCTTRTQTHCVTLGIPPTWHVAAARWKLPALAAQRAAKYVDAYLWFGRPWLTGQTNPFELTRALPECRTTPYRDNGTSVG